MSNLQLFAARCPAAGSLWRVLAVCLALLASAPIAWASEDITASDPCNADFKTAEDFRAFAACRARNLQLPAEIATAVMEIESGFDPLAKGAAGEIGLMQVMPATARMLGFRGNDTELADPAVNIALGVQYLAKSYQLAGGDLCTTVMKYRAGHKQSRFSQRSVDYCRRARTILIREGFQVAGEVPVPDLAETATAKSTARYVNPR